MIQLTRSGTVFRGSDEDLEKLRLEFSRYHCICLPQLLEPELLSFLQQRIDRAGFYTRSYGNLGADLSMTENAGSDLLHILINDRKLFRLLEQIAQCDRIGCFAGRVYRLAPEHTHSFTWHNDLGDPEDKRLLGMSVNLSREAFSGGAFQIRGSNSEQLLREIANTGRSNAILFRLSYSLQHRVTPLEGTVPKTAFAGWFKSEPDFYVLLKKKLSEFA